MADYLVLGALLLGGWLLWRRRAGRRSAAALERIAGAVDPEGPPGRMVKPRGVHGSRLVTRSVTATVGGLMGVARVCVGCGLFWDGDRTVGIVVVLCAACEPSRSEPGDARARDRWRSE